MQPSIDTIRGQARAIARRLIIHDLIGPPAIDRIVAKQLAEHDSRQDKIRAGKLGHKLRCTPVIDGGSTLLKRIKAMRGLTNSALAEALGKSKSWVDMQTSGARCLRVAHAVEIERKLGLQPGEITGEAA